MRFNSPPGWPVPPEGWRPPERWAPDPSWPAAPDGWTFWVEESMTTAVPSSSPADGEDSARQDIRNAIRRMGRTLGIKRELRNLEAKLDPGEHVQELARVERGGHGCLLAVTDRRLLFMREGMVRSTIEEVTLGAITSVASKRRLTNGVLLVTVAGNAEVWPMTSATHCERVSAAIRQAVRGQGQPKVPPASVPQAQSDLTARLAQLADLRAAGALTEDEFATAKARLLGS